MIDFIQKYIREEIYIKLFDGSHVRGYVNKVLDDSIYISSRAYISSDGEPAALPQGRTCCIPFSSIVWVSVQGDRV